jgi:uncharacterized membrane protein
MPEVMAANVGWMVWNLVLAAIPAALAIPLFAPGRRPSPLWWAGLAVFVAFLPNAPYVLTDVIHFTADVRRTPSDLVVTFGLIPQYGVFFLLGFGCYAISLLRLERWLRARGVSVPRVLAMEGAIHALCAVGIFLGRVFRFNSWDLVTRPDAVVDVVRIPQLSSVVLLLLTFAVLAGGTTALRAVIMSVTWRPTA